MANEKRCENRMPVDLILNKYINGEPHVCRGVNLSRGGMLLHKIFEPDLLHHEVTLEFMLPGSDEVIRAEGKALMESPTSRSVGVRFTEMTERARAQIDRFLRGAQVAAQRPQRAFAGR